MHPSLALPRACHTDSWCILLGGAVREPPRSTVVQCVPSGLLPRQVGGSRTAPALSNRNLSTSIVITRAGS